MAQPLASRLSLKHLRLIVAIARHGQLSLAAGVLSISQPAASRSLTEIEALVGTPLFDRNPKGMTLTPVGEGLARRARAILEELADAADEVEQLRLGRGGVVRIGAVTGAAVGHVVPVLRRLKALAPGVELHVEVATSEELVNGLMALRHDMILGRLPVGARPEDFRVERGNDEHLCIVSNSAHPALQRQDLGLSDLVGSEWVMQAAGSPIRRAIEEAFLTLGTGQPRNITNTASLLVVLAMLRDPDVVTPVSREVADLLTATSPRLCRMAIRETIRIAPYALVTLQGRRLSPVAARCHELLNEMLRGGAVAGRG